MLDERTSAAAAGMGAAATAAGTSKSNPILDQEQAWKSKFRQTLNDVMEQGFGSYAQKINEEKLEELRKKILEAMGLSEEDLSNMPPEQRQQIEKMVSLEIQKRLSAEKALEGGADPANPDGLSAQVRATPNGLGAAFVMMQEMDTANDGAPTDKKDPDKG